MKIHKRVLKIETLTSRELMAADTVFATSETSALEAVYGADLLGQLMLFDGPGIARGLRWPRGILTNLII